MLVLDAAAPLPNYLPSRNACIRRSQLNSPIRLDSAFAFALACSNTHMRQLSARI